MGWTGPILDNHLHLDVERGVGMSVVDDFVNAGGTHMLIVNKPSWWYGADVRDPADFVPGFRSTRSTVERVSAALPGRAWAVFGVHPALISRLVDAGIEPAAAAELMQAGIDRAGNRVRDGEALAIKSGRPHYPVDDDVWEASNAVLRHALQVAASVGCAVQLHTESGDSFDDISAWAADAGLAPQRVIKHYADGPLSGITPSVISHREALETTAADGDPFLMETDYLDDPDRPGAVLGTKTVPRRVDWLAESGATDAIRRAHVETPRSLYDIDTRATLAD